MQLKNNISLLFIFLAIFLYGNLTAQVMPYPVYKNRRVSLGKRNYYINPLDGNDDNNGLSSKKPWKTFRPVNRLILSAGDVVNVLKPGAFHESMVIMANGRQNLPVKIVFAAGRYDFFPDGAIKKQLYISNTNDTPYSPKAIAIMFDSCRFVEVQAAQAKIELRGKMIETFIDASTNIQLNGISYDYQRPTVSELKVVSTGINYADLLIHPDAKFSIRDSTLTWEGEGWSYIPDSYWQVFNPQTNEVSRIDIHPGGNRFVSAGGRNVRVYFGQNPGFKKGLIYQNRDVTRDCAGIFMRQSKNIGLKNVRIYFMHGMGVVSQDCENIKMSHVIVKPAESSGRTCAAWADILHFSGCKGKIEIGNSYLSAANDDAINIHGTHLKIIEKLNSNQIKVKFMHGQTFGFNAYRTGDSINFVNPQSLLPYLGNTVSSAEMLNDKEILLTLKLPVTAAMHLNDVIENITATPEVWIHNDTIARIPTRGILTTSGRKTVIEHNELQRTHMSGIFISDDASNWYESGAVKDVTISNNHFNKCGGPVIEVHPENTIADDKIAVHSNIRILNNSFQLLDNSLFKAKSTAGIKISGNTIQTAEPVTNINELIKLTNCTGISVLNNKLLKALQ
jgi:hypothetical protein